MKEAVKEGTIRLEENTNVTVNVSVAVARCRLTTGAAGDTPHGNLEITDGKNTFEPGIRTFTGRNVIIEAKPDKGYALDSWIIDGVTVEAEDTVLDFYFTKSEHEVLAVFKSAELPEMQRTITVTPVKGGKITAKDSRGETLEAENGRIIVAKNERVTFEAVPATRYYSFTGWTGDFSSCGAENDQLTLPVARDITIGADFGPDIIVNVTFGAEVKEVPEGTDKPTVDVTALDADGNEFISGSEIVPGEVLRISSKIDQMGYRLCGWQIGKSFRPYEGEPAGSGELEYEVGDSDTEISPVYVKTYKVFMPDNQAVSSFTVLDKGLAGGNDDGKILTVDSGSDVRFAVKLANNYVKSKKFAVTVNGEKLEAGADGTYTISNIKDNKNIQVEGVVHMVNVSLNTKGLKLAKAAAKPAGKMQAGKLVTITVTPNSGRAFRTNPTIKASNKNVTFTKWKKGK